MRDEKKSNPDGLSSFESFGHGWDYLAKLQHNDLQPPPSLCGGIWARCSIAHIDTHDTEITQQILHTLIGYRLERIEQLWEMFPFQLARKGLGASRGLIDRNVMGVIEGGEERDAYHKAFSLCSLLISLGNQPQRHTTRVWGGGGGGGTYCLQSNHS